MNGFFVRCTQLSDGSKVYDVRCDAIGSDPASILVLSASSQDQAWEVRDALAAIVAKAEKFNLGD